MRVPLFPKPALGVVRLDGHVISEGSVITAKGDLVVNTGSFDPGYIQVFNEDILWEPVSVVGRQMRYSVSTGGNFYIKNTDGDVLLTFSVVIPQDFNIELVEYYSDAEQPEHITFYGTYCQRSYTSTHTHRRKLVVTSLDNDIDNLDIEFDNCSMITGSLVKTARRVEFDFNTSGPDGIIRILIGNVLVFYAPRTNPSS